MYQDPNHVVADQYYLASGTSMSSPIIAGVVALRLSHTPNLDQIQLMKLLKNAHDPPISNEPIGFGKVNLLQWLIQSPSISQVQLTNPQENNYLFTPIQPSLSIYGTGQQVTNYRLEYSQGLYPTSWQTIIDSDQPLNSSNPQLLTTWTPQVSPDQSYTLRFTGFDQSNNPDVALTRLSFYDPNLGWMTNLGSPYISSPVTGDLNADGQSEIIVVNTPTAFSNDLNLNIFNADGTSFLPSLPLRIQGGYGGFGSTPAIGDINQDNHQEIILAGTNKFEYPFQEEGTLTIISDLGIPLPGWDPKTIDDGISLDSRWCRGWQHPDRHCGGFQSAPVLADLDKDGNLDIIILSNFGKLYVFHGDGSSLSPFPLLLGQPYWFGNTHNSPAVGDLNQDGNLEIVVALGENNVPEAGTYIYVIDHTGTVQPGWPKIIIGDDPSQATYYSSINAPPILVDIDQDHKLEIFVLSWNEQGGLIHGWNEDGSNIPGWPVSVPGAMYSLSAGRFSNFTSPVIFAATYRPDFPQKVFAFAPEGQPLPNWPLNTSINAMTGQAILGNFDTDSDQEVFFNSGITNQGIAYNYDGSLAEGWPKNIRTSSWRTPTLIYPEMNRSLIVIADTNSGFLQAFELPLLQIMQSSWGTFQQNTFHTGVLPGRLSYTLVDLDNDGDTDILDYFIFQPLYGDIENHGDINQDGLTNLYDFNLLIQP